MKLEYITYFPEIDNDNKVNNTNKRLNELLYALKASIMFERRFPMTLDQYASIVNRTNPSAKWIPCNSCSSAVRVVHNQFQTYIWNEIKKEKPELLLEIGQLKGVKFNTSFYRELFKVNALEYCKNCQDDCDFQAANLLKGNNPANLKMREFYLEDYKTIQNYIKRRINYFDEFLPEFLKSLKDDESITDCLNDSIEIDNKVETRGKGMMKITKEQVLELQNKGLSLTEIANELKVNKSTVSRKLKEV